MAGVILVMSMSLDGFISGANPRPEAPMGDDGLVLHQWIQGGEQGINRRFLTESIDRLGSVICGRRTYDTSLPGWGADGPTGAARRPVFVVTHRAPDTRPEGGVYTFVTGGIEEALRQARMAAGSKEISIMGGANIGQQYLQAGLVDDIQLQLVPVLLGAGTRLFDHLERNHIPLETVQVLDTPSAIHLRYRMVK